ncbi:hypothetical protein [Nonomuraea sp. SYSU D8015]|uniref:hypothetical protein n=1 Tax=Nonomuraea sp. SYSU D8015 TaxID=2593644 RepID=UPI0016610E23|nr:hypothetical protein [Nonomuraea sp. SYSU D8015]
MRRRLGILAVAMFVMPAGILGLAGPASAAKGPTRASGCVKTGNNPYSTYGTADNTTNRVSVTNKRAVISAEGIGRTYDCGPAGRPQAVPDLTVEITYTVDGSAVNCSIGGDLQGNASFSCARDRSRITATDTYTCKNTSTCKLGYSSATFTAASNGRITNVQTVVKVTLSGSGGSQSAASDVDIV